MRRSLPFWLRASPALRCAPVETPKTATPKVTVEDVDASRLMLVTRSFLAKRQPGAAASRRLHTALANKTDELPLVFLATVAGAPWPATAKLPDALRLNIRRRIVMGAADLDGVSVARLFIAWAKAPEHARDVKMFTLLGKLLTYHVNDVRNPLLLLGLLRAVERSGLQPPREFLELLGRRLTALSRPGALVEPALSAKSAFAALRTLHAVDALQGDTAHGLHKRIIIDLRCAVNVVVDARDASKNTATREAYVTALEKSRTVPLPSMIAEEDAAFDETLAATLVEAKAVHGALKGKMPELTVKEAQRALSLAGLRVKDLPTLLGALRDTGARRGPGMVVTAIMAPFLASSSPAVLGQVAGIAAHMPATNEKFQSALIGRLIKSAPTCHPRDLLDGVKVLLQSHHTTKPCERVPDLVAAIQGRAKHAAPLELNVMLGCLRLITKMDPTAKAAAQIVVQETASRWEELMEKHLVPLPACRTFLRAAKKLELADDCASLKSKYDLVVGDEGGMEAYRRSSPSMLFGTLALNSAARFGATPSQEKRRLLAAFRHHFLRRRETHKLLKCLDCIECTYLGTLQSPIKALFCSVLLEQFDAAAAGRKALKVEDLAAFVESVKKAPEGIRMNRGVWTLLARMAKEAELADLTTECKALAKLC